MSYSWHGWESGRDVSPEEPFKEWLTIEEEDGEEIAVIVLRTDASCFIDDPEALEAARAKREHNAQRIVQALNEGKPGEVSVPRALLLSLLEPLRLSYVYTLLGSESEDHLGDDFKPWKWYGHEAVHANECMAAYRRVMDVLSADPQPLRAGTKSSSPRS